MAHVKFREDYSVPEELAKLERFTRVFEYFATVFGVNFVIDAPHGTAVKPDETVKDTIFIHVFSSPTAQRLQTISAAFGFKFMIPAPETGEPLPSYSRPAEDRGRTCFTLSGILSPIYDRSATALAGFIGTHLYIFFDIAHREWAGDTIVLRHILSAALSKMLSAEACGLALARECLTAKRFHKKVVAELPQLSDVLFGMFRSQLIAQIKQHEEAQIAAARLSEEASRDLINLGFQAVELEHSLRHVARLIEKSDIAKEFETILSWSNVKGIRIEDDNLVVYTNPLTMERPEGVRFLIGEYKIVIKPHSNIDLSFWVQVAEYGWRGPYSHTVVRNLSTQCWGGAIKPALVKALEEYDLVYAVSDALSFLIAESSTIPQFSWGPARVPPSEQTPFYQSEEDRRIEKTRYAAFVTQLRKNAAEGRLKENLTKTQERIKSEAQKLFEARSTSREHTIRKTFLERCAAALAADEELAVLRDIPSLVALEAHGDRVWAIFSPKLSEKYEAIKPGFVLAFSTSGSVEIDRFGSPTTKISTELSENDRPFFTRLALFGMFGTALRALYGYATEERQALYVAQKRLEEFLNRHTVPVEES